jgi:nucleotide-binding universal stress UspA family protein
MNGSAILVPLDGSHSASNALPVAKLFGSLEHAPVRILHVADRTSPMAEVATQLGVAPAELRGISIEARAGEPSAVIIERARETARLVVLCTHTAPGEPHRSLGRTALAVVERASCPVVLVNPRCDMAGWSLRTILVPHEGAPTREALNSAAHLARRAGAELLVLQVATAGCALPKEPGSIPPPLYLDQAQHEWPAWAGEFLERVSCLCALEGVRVRLMLGHGAPGEEILRVARQAQADLIVLTWKGRWAPEHAATFKAVVRDASCPTMVMREKAT